jgi:hypothetical protein
VGQICQDLVGVIVKNARTHGDFEKSVVSVGAGLLFAAPVFATFCTPQGLAPQFKERRTPIGGHKNDIATPSTVTAVGTSKGHVFFTSKRSTALAPITTGYGDTCFINESHNLPPQLCRAEMGCLCLRLGDYTDQSPVVPLVVPNMSIDCSEDGPITAHAHTITRMKTGSELTDDDVSSLDELSITALQSPILGV